MDVKQYLEENGIIELYRDVDYDNIFYNEFLDRLAVIVERYKNNQTIEYQARILSMYTKVDKFIKEFTAVSEVTVDTQGKI